MDQLLSKTLAQIVNENHQAASVFEKYGLDFCCKGKRSLQIACDEKELSTTEVTSELESVINKDVKPVVDFDNMSLTELANYIVATHHGYVRQEVPLIFGYLQKIASKHGDRHPELHKIFESFSAVKEELMSHMHKEEFVLFPRIAGLEKAKERYDSLSLGYLLGPVSMMEHEHEHVGNLLEVIKLLSNNYTPPADACTTYRLVFAALKSFETDLHQHIHLENNILFPKTLKLFRQVKETALN